MRKPTVDYRGFSLRKLNDPRFSHLKLLGGWLGYFAMYLITEYLNPNNSGTAVSCSLEY